MWLAGRASGEFGRRSRRSRGLLGLWFGVGSVIDRGRTLRSAAGLDPGPTAPPQWRGEPIILGDPTLLHSRYRAALIAGRDRLLEFERSQRRITILADGRTARVRTTLVKVVAAGKAVMGDGPRAGVLLALGNDFDDAAYYSLSIPDAHDLVRMVSQALDTPIPPGS